MKFVNLHFMLKKNVIFVTFCCYNSHTLSVKGTRSTLVHFFPSGTGGRICHDGLNGVEVGNEISGRSSSETISKNQWEFQWHIHRLALRALFSRSNLNLVMLGFFCGGKKTGVPGEKPSEQGREPTTNSTHI